MISYEYYGGISQQTTTAVVCAPFPKFMLMSLTNVMLSRGKKVTGPQTSQIELVSL